MSDDQSARLNLPYLAAGQMQKHVTLNEALTALDVLVQTRVVSRTVEAQPQTPGDGDLYILPDNRAGADWDGFQPGALVRAEGGGWLAVDPVDGMLARVADADEFVVWTDGAWQPLGASLGEIRALKRFGLDATPDAGNPFIARLNQALWTARESSDGGDGDLRLSLNKERPEDMLSLVFQSGFGGRAELGLIGNDDLSLKVSEDGSLWRQAVRVDRATGTVQFDRGVVRRETAMFTTDGEWTPPAWARSVEASLVGAGGGGGAGAHGPAGDRPGGGGGGAGGVAIATCSVDQLTHPLQIDIGQGGAGGTGGLAGSDGGDTRILMGGTAIFAAGGGGGGRTGLGGEGRGGEGGPGSPRSNAGGSSRAGMAGDEGESHARPDGPGGGGAGGSVNEAGTASAGGAGGVGGALAVRANGGIGGSDGGGWGGWSAPLPGLHASGGGGGGGGGSASGSGHSGADGGDAGAGGGGGGAGVVSGGHGGAGANGAVRLTAVG
jgi:Protein of unknown function (DUF2793)